MTINKLIKDIEFGEDCEDKLKEKFEKNFCCCLTKTKKNAIYDYIDKNNKVIIELKSRRNNKNKYKTTMIGLNKILNAEKYKKEGYKIYLCFNYLDRLSYVEIDNDFKYEVKKGGRRDRGRPEYKQYCYIDINNLKDIL